MKTFQDLMAENPMVVQQNTDTKEGGNDTLTRWYNMHWGNLTDTHMQHFEDGTYVVIGSRLTKEKWEGILWNRVVSTAPGTLLPHTWAEVLQVNHMDWCYTTHNGSFAIGMRVKEGEETGVITIPPVSSVGGNQCITGRGC